MPDDATPRPRYHPDQGLPELAAAEAHAYANAPSKVGLPNADADDPDWTADQTADDDYGDWSAGLPNVPVLDLPPLPGMAAAPHLSGPQGAPALPSLGHAPAPVPSAPARDGAWALEPSAPPLLPRSDAPPPPAAAAVAAAVVGPMPVAPAGPLAERRADERRAADRRAADRRRAQVPVGTDRRRADRRTSERRTASRRSAFQDRALAAALAHDFAAPDTAGPGPTTGPYPTAKALVALYGLAAAALGLLLAARPGWVPPFLRWPGLPFSVADANVPLLVALLIAGGVFATALALVLPAAEWSRISTARRRPAPTAHARRTS